MPAGFSWPHDSPLAVVNVCGTETWMDPSYTNEDEAAEIVRIIKKMHRAGVQASSMGVISPYGAQTKLLRELLCECSLDLLSDITLGNVDAFQGKNMMSFSCL